MTELPAQERRNHQTEQEAPDYFLLNSLELAKEDPSRRNVALAQVTEDGGAELGS